MHAGFTRDIVGQDEKTTRPFPLSLSLSLIPNGLLVNQVLAAASSPWTQTDWSGGSGQTSWTDSTKFSSSSTTTTSTAGQVTLSTNAEKLSNTGFESNLTSWNTGSQPDSTSGLQVWLKADSITGLSDDEAVTTWTDSSSVSNNVTQSTADKKPLYKTNIINSQPVVRFDGTNDTLTGAFSSSVSTPYTLFAVATFRSSYTSQEAILDGGGDLNGYLFRSVNNSSAYFNNSNQIGSVAATTNNWNIYSVLVNGASSALRANNGTAATGTLAGTALLGLRLAERGGGVEFGDVDIAEVMVYNSALSTSDRQGLEAYLQGKYGINAGYATLTRDTTTTYSSSSGSAKLVTGANATSFNQYVNVGDTNSYNLSAYAYTSGSAVTSSDVELFYNGSTVSTTYTSVGGGWYQLSGTVTGANASRQYGVQVKASKTVYVDNFSLNNYATSGTVTSSIFDTENLNDGTQWGALTYNAATPSNTSVAVKVRTSNSSSMVGATDFSSCLAISSGTDISSNSCVTDGHRYIQYQLTLANTDFVSTPTFQDISLAYSAYDITGPVLTLDSPSGNDYTNNERPTFRWKEATDAVSSIADYDLIIDNPSLGSGQPSGDFTISDIPVSRTADYETSKYKVVYEGGYISVFTKSSTSWSTDSNSGENDGKLREGKVSWKVKVTDSVGNITESSRTLFVDRTNPRTEWTQINEIATSQAPRNDISTTDKTPTIFGKITDPLAGGDTSLTQDENGPRIASGPKSVEIKIEKKAGLTYILHTTYTINIDKAWYTCGDIEITDNTKQKCDKYLPFEYTPKDSLGLGTYKVTLTGKDKADNSSTTSFNLNVGTFAEISEQFTSGESEPTPEVLQPDEEGNITIPTPVVEPSALDRAGESITQAGRSLIQAIGDFLTTIFTGIGNGIAFVFDSIGSGLAFVWNGIEIAASAVSDGFLAMTHWAGQGLAFVGNAIGNRYTNLANSAPGALKNVLIAIGNGFSATGNVIGATAHSIGQGLDNAATATKSGVASVAFAVGEKTQYVSDRVGLGIIKFTYNFVSEPTTISDVKVEVLSSTSTRVTWLTNHPATGKVNYGLDRTYPFDTQTDKRTTHHEFTLSNLTPDTLYYFEVMSQNKNYVYDANREFRTLPK